MQHHEWLTVIKLVIESVKGIQNQTRFKDPIAKITGSLKCSKEYNCHVVIIQSLALHLPCFWTATRIRILRDSGPQSPIRKLLLVRDTLGDGLHTVCAGSPSTISSLAATRRASTGPKSSNHSYHLLIMHTNDHPLTKTPPSPHHSCPQIAMFTVFQNQTTGKPTHPV